MTALITLDEAKRQLRIEIESEGEFDAELEDAIDEASAIVLDYLKVSDSPEWTIDTAPPLVRRAVKMVLTNIWDHRGDPELVNPLSQAVKDTLHRMRDPTLA